MKPMMVDLGWKPFYVHVELGELFFIISLTGLQLHIHFKSFDKMFVLSPYFVGVV